MKKSFSVDKQVECDRYNSRANEYLAQDSKMQPLLTGAHALPHVLRAPYLWYEQQLTELLQPYHRVLEIGSGTGLHTSVLLRSGANVTASDISRKSLEVLLLRYASFDNLYTEVADMEHLPFANESFDFVVMAGSLSYGDQQQVKDEILRVLKPMGSFICVDSLNHNPLYKFNRWVHYLRGERTKSTLERMPTKQALGEYAKAFEQVEVRYYGGLFWMAPILTLLMSDIQASKILDWTDQLFRVSGSAFKFVMIAKRKKSERAD